MINRISRKYQYPRKKNGSKRRSRRNKSVKYRFTTKRKMNKMKGGALTWECTCENPDKTGRNFADQTLLSRNFNRGQGEGVSGIKISPLNQINEQTRPPSRMPNVSTVLQSRMIRENSNGTYQIDSREKLPKWFEDGDIIIDIDGYPASKKNIKKLYGGDIGETAVVRVQNNQGGTRKTGIRTIMIKYL